MCICIRQAYATLTDVLPTPAGLPVAESIGVLPSPPIHMYDPQEYKDLQADKPDTP